MPTETLRLEGRDSQGNTVVRDTAVTTAATAPRFVVGAAVNGPNNTGHTYAEYERVEGILAMPRPLAPARFFDGGSVAISTQCRNALNDGRPVYYSIAQDVEATIRGDLDQRIRDMAVALAAVPGSGFIQRHEPENPSKNIPGARFVLAQKRFYSVAKTAAPSLQVGYANMAYQYVAGRRGADGSYICPDADTDFHGVDVYNYYGPNIGEAKRLEVSPDFQGWWAKVAAKAKPKRLIEYGLRGSTQAVTNTILQQDRAYLENKPVDMVLFWLGWGDNGDWQTGFLNATPPLRNLYG